MGHSCFTARDVDQTPRFEIHTSTLNSQVHYKDRFFTIFLPKLPSESNERTNLLSKWLHELVSSSMSVAFNYRRQDKMDKQATTIFACQNIIRSLIEMSYNQEVTSFDFAQLDQIFSKKILPSIKVKYPMSQQKQNNLTLMKQFDVIDNFDTKENDYIINSNVVFQYRTNGKYEDLIMSFLNELIELPDRKVNRIKLGEKDKLDNQTNSDYLTIYQYFEEFMRYLFESVSDYDTMNESKSAETNETAKNKYRQEIKSYTSYQIGRKIPSDTSKFDNEAIRAQQIKVKNAGVLRIMTKWAEELWDKFQDKHYFINLVENPVLINKKESFAFSLSKKQKLQSKIHNEMKKIENDMEVIRRKNQDLQAQILNDTKNNKIPYVQDKQLQEVYFSGRTLSVLQVNLSKYLNRLIHGLASVSKDICKDFKMSPPILLFTTFKLGDLIRCKCKSKQKEIIYIYKQLKKISDQNPKFLKIIRVKNRLEQGTKDVLINIRFYEKITAEIQLGIRSESKKYTEDSTDINHTLYELERSIFGPISEICSILYNLNKDQSKIMQKAINESLKRRKDQESESEDCLHKFRPYTEPFLCSKCFDLNTSNEKIIANVHCTICTHRECSNCRLKSLPQNELKQIIFEDENLIRGSELYWPERQDFKPLKQGIAIYKLSKRRIVTPFKFYEINLTDTLITCRQFSDPIIHMESWPQFCSQYLIWKNDEVPTKIFKDITKYTIIQKCYLSQVFQKYCKQERKKVNLQKSSMSDEFYSQKALNNWTEEYRSKIQTLSLQCNKITDMKAVLQITPNLVELVLDDNHIQVISFPDSMKKLKTLSLKRNAQLQKIDSKIKHPESLQKLIFGWNFIYQNIPVQKQRKEKDFYSELSRSIPSDISIFKNLKTLQVLYNGIRKLPKQIESLKELKYINLEGNFFEEIPQELFTISDLDKIFIGQNFIKKISPSIKNLKNLRVFLVPNNLITQIPTQFETLTRLQTFVAEGNQISVYPNNLINLAKLVRLNLNDNKLPEIHTFKNDHVTQFSANDNKIVRIPEQISTSMKNLLILSMCGNHIESIPEKIWSFERLQKLLLNKCDLTELMYPVTKFPSLKVLQLEENKLRRIDGDIINFPNLQELCVKMNPIETIASEMKHLKKLNYMTLDHKGLEQNSLKVYENLREYSWLNINGNDNDEVQE